MRTTITIDDGLLDDAKRRAEELHVTFSALVEQGLRAVLATAAPRPERPPFRLHTFRGDGLVPGLSWERLGDDTGDDELERFLAAEP